MRTTLFSTLLVLATLAPASCADSPESVDLQKIYNHIHKTYSTPSSAKLQITDLKPSPIAGLFSGTFEISEGPQKQSMGILVSKDGRYYIISDVFETVQSSVPALRLPVAKKDQPSAPPVLVSKDGRYVVLAPIQDASVDPEAEALSKMDLKSVPGVGPADAPVILVEYSDLECPFCQKAHELLEKDILPAYPGKIRWIFKSYPLQGIHPWAYQAAIAADCVAKVKPDSYMKFIETVFRAQSSIRPDIKPEELRSKLLSLAKEAGVEGERLATCYDKEESKPQVEASIREGDSLGVTGTPTIFVNGRRLRGYQPPEVKRIIDEMLGTTH